jgi:hypothetical protein
MLSAACLVGTVLLMSRLAALPALAVYALSFWHYLFYWWAYRHGVVQPARFRRDAILMKSVALTALASTYLTQPWHWGPALVITAGFMLNLAGTRALGAARTFYGWELGELPPQRVTSFPYSVVPHPMLAGNMMAFGGALLHPGFRETWWPLAVLHVALNGALIVMETSVTPRRQTGQTGQTRQTPRSGAEAFATIAAFVAFAALAASVAAVLACPAGWAPVAIAAGASAAYGYAQRGWYVPAPSPGADAARNHSRSQEVA